MMGCNCEWSCTCERDSEARQLIKQLTEERKELADSWNELEKAFENHASDKTIVNWYRIIKESKEAIKSFEDELEELL